MTMSRPKVVSLFTSIQGHWSLAQAIGEALTTHDYQVHYNKHHGLELRLYKLLYQRYPRSFGWFYNLGMLGPSQQLYERYSTRTYDKIVKEQLAEQNPDLIISTWFTFNPILETIALKRNIPFLNIIANPRTIHPAEITEEHPNWVFDNVARSQCLALAVPRNQVVVSGWFVQDKFEQTFNRDRLRIQFGIKPDSLTFLVQSGSDGSQRTLQMVKQLVKRDLPPEPVHIIFACGNNARLYHEVDTLSRQTPRSIKLVALPFTSNLHLYMQAADLVIGKAGPNTLFEAVATNSPFFATNHIKGQEDGNLDIIKDYRLGYVEENVTQAVRLLHHIIVQPEILGQFQAPITQMKRYNHQAKQILLKHIDRLLSV